MLARERADTARASMITASFTAWQVRGAQGEKVSWDKYLKRLGLGKADAGGCDNQTAIDTALQIHNDLQAAKK